MARYDMTAEITKAGLDLAEVAAVAETISKGCTWLTGGILYAQSRSGEQAVRQAAATITRRAASAARQAAGETEVAWYNHGGAWCIKGSGLVEGQVATAVRRDGQAEKVFVGRIVATTTDGQQVARYSYTKEA